MDDFIRDSKVETSDSVVAIPALQQDSQVSPMTRPTATPAGFPDNLLRQAAVGVSMTTMMPHLSMHDLGFDRHYLPIEVTGSVDLIEDVAGGPCSQILAIQNELESGLYKDSKGDQHALTKERQDADYLKVYNLIHQVVVPVQTEELAATAIERPHWFDDDMDKWNKAEDHLVRAVASADAVPIKMIRKEIELLSKPGVSAAYGNSAILNELQNDTQLPITERMRMARFYLSGDEFADGKTFNDAVVDGYDHFDQPQFSELKTSIMASNAAKAAQEIWLAASMEKQIDGVDLVQHPELLPQLMLFRQEAAKNLSKDELESLKIVTHYFDGYQGAIEPLEPSFRRHQ